ncbi:MAG: DUF2442 domain-containing protein [Bacteroides sp.]|nr:DUF2442 domain-containing protein [Bacteroides sp.]MCM1086394.1 DUF2442 domain-containing protein [Bacteroides sp.]
MAMQLYISRAEYLGGLAVRLSFNDGVVQDVNFAPFFEKYPHPQYNKYREPEKFKKFFIDHGNIVWGKNWDMIFPIDALHAGKVE